MDMCADARREGHDGGGICMMTLITEQIACQLERSGRAYRRPHPACVVVELHAGCGVSDAQIFETYTLIRCVATNLAAIPERLMPEMLRATNHLNSTVIKWGAFSIHPRSRELSFELAMPIPDTFSEPMLGRLLTGLDAVGAYYPVFMRILWQGMVLESALADVAVRRRVG
jgi:hypothetical protein